MKSAFSIARGALRSSLVWGPTAALGLFTLALKLL